MGKSNKQAEVGHRASGAPGPAACGEEGDPAGMEVGAGVHAALPAQPVPRAAAVHKNDKNSTGLQSSAFEGKTKPATLPFSPNQTLPFPYLQPFKGEGFRYLLWGWWGSQ